MLFSVCLGSSGTVDLVGILVGHVYYFLEDVVRALLWCLCDCFPFFVGLCPCCNYFVALVLRSSGSLCLSEHARISLMCRISLTLTRLSRAYIVCACLIPQYPLMTPSHIRLLRTPGIVSYFFSGRARAAPAEVPIDLHPN